MKNTETKQTPAASDLSVSTGSPRLRWKKDNGAYRATTHTLSRGGDWLAIIQATGDGRWFWYGCGKNTSSSPTNLETAKAEAKAHVLSFEANGKD